MPLINALHLRQDNAVSPPCIWLSVTILRTTYILTTLSGLHYAVTPVKGTVARQLWAQNLELNCQVQIPALSPISWTDGHLLAGFPDYCELKTLVSQECFPSFSSACLLQFPGLSLLWCSLCLVTILCHLGWVTIVLCLRFLLCKVGILTYQHWWCTVRIKCVNVC